MYQVLCLDLDVPILINYKTSGDTIDMNGVQFPVQTKSVYEFETLKPKISEMKLKQSLQSTDEIRATKPFLPFYC